MANEPTARQHLNTVVELAQDLLKRPDAKLDDAYELIQEADDALTDALNRLGSS